jgi:hypothetical protein
VLTGQNLNTGNQFTVRADHSLPRNQNLMFRYTQVPSLNCPSSMLANGSGMRMNMTNYNTGVTWNAALSPVTVNEFRVGFARFHTS